MQAKTSRLVILVLFFISGVAGLVYELIWTRKLVLIFGNTLFANSTVLSSFMAGLAGGSFFWGKYIDRKERPLVKLYAFLELSIGLFALIFPLILDLVDPFYATVYRSLSEELFFINLARFLICFLIIFVPTFLMGGTLPILVKYFIEKSQPLGNRAGLLYGLNTAGALLGCLVCGFFLLRTFGMQISSLIAVGLNIGVGLAAWLLSLHGKSAENHAALNQTTEQIKEAVVGNTSRTTVILVLIGIGISGFCSLSYEVFWSRMLTLFFRNTVYSFTTILATFLAGISLGSLIYYRFFSRISQQVVLFSLLEIAIAVTCYITPYIFITLYDVLFSQQLQTMIFLKSTAIMIVPTVLMGMALPSAIEICQQGPRREGTSVGKVYAVNTIGSIIGPFFAGFIFIPLIGIHQAVIVVAGLNLIAGVLALASAIRLKAKIVSVITSAAFFVILFSVAPPNLFYRLYQTTQPHANILTYKEGTVANVVVYDFWKEGYKDLYLNGVEEASSRVWHVQLFKLLGMLPPLLHENPDNALMIAFGAGMSAGASLDLVENLDCVELNPDIQEVATIFKHENNDVFNNKKFNLIVNDGRNYLYLSPKKYSVIISDATNPMSFDSWTLYSKEFYELCKKKLKPGGIFSQWVPMPLSNDALKIILNTFKSVFPHTSFWVIHGSSQCLMLATPKKLSIDYQALKRKLEPIIETSGLAEFGVRTVEKFLSFFFCGEDKLDSLLKNFNKISLDDLPHAQFYGKLNKKGIQASLDLIPYQESVESYLSNVGDAKDRLHNSLQEYLEIARVLNLGFLKSDQQEYEKALFLASGSKLQEDENIKCMLKYDRKRKSYFLDRIKMFPNDHNAHNTLGYVYLREKNYPQAIGEFRKATQLKPDFANAHVNLASAYLQSGAFDLATEKWFEIQDINPTNINLYTAKHQLALIRLRRKIHYQPNNPLLHKELGQLHLSTGQFVKAVKALVKAVSLAPNDLTSLVSLGNTYEGLGMMERALAAYEKVKNIIPDDPRIDHKIADIRSLLTGGGDQSYLRVKLPSDEADVQSPSENSFAEAMKIWNDFEFDGKVNLTKIEEAAAKLESLIRRDKKMMRAYAEAANLYEILGKYKKAASILQQGLEVSPGYKIAENQKKRLELLDRLAGGRHKPEELARIYHEIGLLYWANHEIEMATSYFQKAIDLNSNDTSGWINLGLCQIDSGQYELALKSLKQAIELKPDLDQIDQISKKTAWLREILTK